MSIKESLFDEAERIKDDKLVEKYDRNRFEDKKAMDSYKEEFFGDKKTQKDPYTGKTLHRDKEAAKRKYKNSGTANNMNPDHDDPLQNAHSRNKGKKYITNDDLYEVGNQKRNFRPKSEKNNKSKRSDYNKTALKNSNKSYGDDFKPGMKTIDAISGEVNKVSTDVQLNARNVRNGVIVNTAGAINSIDQNVDEVKNTIDELKKNVDDVHRKGQELLEKVEDQNNYIANQTSSFFSNDLARINSSGVNQALNAAQFAAALSVSRNSIALIRGNEEIDDAVKEVLKDTSSAAVLGYATGAVTEIVGISDINDAALLVNGTIQISKQIYSYINGEIDEAQLLQNVAETTAYLTAAYIGKTIGASIGSVAGPAGAMVGQYIGEMITTAICSTVIDTIHYERNSIKYNKQMIALAHRAENEIHMSQERLKCIIREQNSELVRALDSGYNKFLEGIQLLDYDIASEGLVEIGNQFGIEAQKLTQGHVIQGNIFGKKTRIIEMG